MKIIGLGGKLQKLQVFWGIIAFFLYIYTHIYTYIYIYMYFFFFSKFKKKGIFFVTLYINS